MSIRYTLTQLPTSPFWYVQWAEGGRSKRRSTGCVECGEAEAWLRAFVLTLETAPTTPLTVSDAITFYRLSKPVISADTATRIASRLKEFFGATPLDRGGPAAQLKYVERRRGDGVKDETIRRELAVLSAAYHYTKKFKELPFVPEVVTLPASPPKERWITRQEAAKLFRALRRPRSLHVLLFARLALYTGARSGAILQLTWDRVDLARGVIDYDLPGVRTSKGRAPARIGPIEIRMLKAAQKKTRTAHVIEWRGEPVERIARAFRAHAKAAGLPDVTPHTLRHTFATWAARKGVPLHDIGGALGHSSPTTTKRYAKHHPDALREVFQAVRRK